MKHMEQVKFGGDSNSQCAKITAFSIFINQNLVDLQVPGPSASDPYLHTAHI